MLIICIGPFEYALGSGHDSHFTRDVTLTCTRVVSFVYACDFHLHLEYGYDLHSRSALILLAAPVTDFMSVSASVIDFISFAAIMAFAASVTHFV